MNLQHDVAIGPMTTYRVGGQAALFARVESVDDLTELTTLVRERGVDVLVVGNGSNLLVADAGFAGLAVVLGESFASVDIVGSVVTAGGAASLPVTARRTAAQGLELGMALEAADIVVVTDVYGARENPQPGVTGMIVARAALDARPWRRLAYLPQRAEIVPYLREVLRPGDLCLTLGAGDITSLADDLLPVLAART